MSPPGGLIGIDIGGTKISVVLGRETGGPGSPIEVTRKAVFPTPVGPEAALRAVRAALGELGGPGPGQGAAFGVSCGGPLDSATGHVLSPPNLPGWNRVPIVDILARELGIPGALQNDANACALAEWRQGAAQRTRNLVFLTFGTGMGAGIILDGRLYEGRQGLAGEVGHVRLSEDGPEGYGKRGSFEGWCSGGGIARLARERATECLRAGTPAALADSPERIERLTARDVFEAARRGDTLARGVVETCGRYLGRGLAMIIDVLNPELIVLGGIYPRAHDLLGPVAEATVTEEALELSRRHCRILPAGLGESLGDIAALSVAAWRVALPPGA